MTRKQLTRFTQLVSVIAVLFAPLAVAQQNSESVEPSQGETLPQIRLEQPLLEQQVPLPNDVSTELPLTGSQLPPAPTGQSPQASPSPANSDSANRSQTNPQPRSLASRRIRLARAPNMFGDFYNVPPTLNFSVPLVGGGGSGQEILGQTTGAIQSPMFGGGPRLKISDNFSPIPRHRIFVQGHYFHNAFSARLTDDTDPSTPGGLNVRRSIFITTAGAEFLSEDEQTSIEFRLPLIHSPATNNTLTDSFYGPIADQNSSGGTVGNLSVILKHVLAENSNYLISGGMGLSVPTARDVTGNLSQVDYSIQNETVNLVPFLAVLFAPQNNMFIQFHSQIDIPVGNDDFRFVVAPSINNPASSGTFGSYRESLLASTDVQAGFNLFSNPNSRCVRSATAIIEMRYTKSLTRSSGAAGSAGEFNFNSGTEVAASLSQSDPRIDYLNMTLGLQFDVGDNWFMRCGQVFPLINNTSFTSETLLQLERRF
jgi:hypothetical protein